MKITTRGGRNLAILGGAALLITVATTSASLLIYRNSGDIYLDRSRPGYLPDEEEAQQDPAASTNFNFPDNGPLDKNELESYLKELDAVNTRLRALVDPYSATPLSDESLGISNNSEPEKPDDSSN